MKIIQALEQHIGLVRDLFREYQNWVNADCCFQGFEEELASLPGRYAPPKGSIYIAFDEQQAIGCSAIRPKQNKPETEAELKRLFVKDVYRGHGVGKRLYKAAMLGAKEMGYESIVLETLPKMEAARSLYRGYGFEPIPNYYQGIDKESDEDSMDSNITRKNDVECYRFNFNIDDKIL